MTKRPTLKMTKLRRGTQELLEGRGMMAAVSGGKPGDFGPVLHGGPHGAAAPATTGGYAALTAGAAFSHGGHGLPAGPAMAGALPAHAELKGHRHRGAEHHSAH
ncbi:hypothetical protein P3T37_001936 [Kitasatospora sp. MAA4]|uniref:hypothetical protein n=1 Tax=Kitasatospora sp. MAA4 TaxID=3035093 RepID=UPI002473233F|nr:hypothetical protein [Kitasatospora sp. MAA4]MDH6132551.1 hypothetical protein [Kitasatospora sp. MAA4]